VLNISIFVIGCWVGFILGLITFGLLRKENQDEKDDSQNEEKTRN
tara:strand:- start:3832 stop:3966 length:135 start_codon:yes stop_codon:yes gene_type:complete